LVKQKGFYFAGIGENIMQLVLFFGKTIVDAMPVDGHKLQQPDYLTCLQYDLLERNDERIEQCTEPVRMALDGVPSSMDFESLLTVYQRSGGL
jgi:hypothetical protein